MLNRGVCLECEHIDHPIGRLAWKCLIYNKAALDLGSSRAVMWGWVTPDSNCPEGCPNKEYHEIANEIDPEKRK